jgi:FeS assembly SUF system regulator
MIRIGKLTDYGIVLLTHLAATPGGAQPGSSGGLFSTRELAEESRLPLPTVEKLLKRLSRSDLLVSERGAHGGYRLARPPERISIADVIAALEGPIALTECVAKADACGLEGTCPNRGHWHKINDAVFGALRDLTLAEMLAPAAPHASFAGGKAAASAIGRESRAMFSSRPQGGVKK